MAPVPDHLERFETPESVFRPVQHNPIAISSSQVPPTQPILQPITFEHLSSTRLNTAIEGLEDLAQEAALTTEDTADPHRMEDIYHIIKDAKKAIQEASDDPTRHLMSTSSPLVASGSSSERSELSSESFSYADGPDLFVPPVQTNMFDNIEELPSARLHNNAHRVSETIDWAYQNVKDDSRSRAASSASSSQRENSVDRRLSRFSTQSDLLLPPEPAQTAPREHVDHLVRPTLSRDHSRGRSRLRRHRDSEPGTRRRRYRRGWRSDNDRSKSRRRHQKHEFPGPIQSDPSFDEEVLHAAGKTEGVRKYGNELRVREETSRHIFSLHRNPRRQPIARNWKNGKKRITATIACINTALLGIIVGIYASSSCLGIHFTI